MARRKRRGGDDHGGGGGGHGGVSGRWLVSYADFITLMFVVFLILFSMARVDAAKYGSLAKSLRASFGPAGPNITTIPVRGQSGQVMPVVPPDGPGNMPDTPDWPGHLISPPIERVRPPVPPKEPPPAAAQPSPIESDPVTVPEPPASLPEPNDDIPSSSTPGPLETEDPLEAMAEAFRELPGVRTGVLAVALQERGLVLTVAGSVLFDPGRTVLKPEAKIFLDQIGGKLTGVERPIMVEGRAGQQSGAESAFSPWDLAALRAGAVVQYLVAERGLPGQQFVTIGYGSDRIQGEAVESKVTIIVMRSKSNSE